MLLKDKYRINILGLGEVGSALLTGLVLLGRDTAESIGIYDIKQANTARCEAEMNQIALARDPGRFPAVKIIPGEDELFDCDIFIFCASKEVPGIGSGVADVRMAQYKDNKMIIEDYARLAARSSFQGVFAVVSDPVDPLCKAAYLASGLDHKQFKGFGLGVMNGRALYYARRDERFSRYISEGRVFGPHGEDLVVADSIFNYDDEISRELTKKVVTENLRIRHAGFKPFIAPALSSGALSIISMLKGEWHYSSNYIKDGEGGAFFGALNRITKQGYELENHKLPNKLTERLRRSYENLKKID